jgi:undecaprenyl phosphate-alpha-L-ara4N flippase subunit ArnE
MAKILIILVIAFTFEAIGVITLKKGIDQIGPRYTERKTTTPLLKNVLKLVGDWFTNKDVLIGLVLETAFFILLQYLLGQRDVSFVWPLTALSFVMTTLAAKIFLHEKVDGVRWGGVALIILGAVLISYSEHNKPKPVEIPASANPDIIQK